MCQLYLFDFVLTTFTNPDAPPPPPSPYSPDGTSDGDIVEVTEVEKLRVRVKLISFVVILNDDGTRIATLSAEQGDVGVLLRGPTMRVTARLGNLALRDDLEHDSIADPAYKRLLAIEGDQVADFVYETYDANEEATYPGWDSLVHLRTGSICIHFLEEPFQRILRFLMRFARMKALLDSARQAAAAQAAGLQAQGVSRMRFDVLVKTPIVVFPRSGQSQDRIVANLGEISAKNRFEDAKRTGITAGLHAIRLTSFIGAGEGQAAELQLLEDLNFDVDLTMLQDVDRATDLTHPDMTVSPLVSLCDGVLMTLRRSALGSATSR
jgi:vacuolar protein sorting-associated protein 13A/C